MKTYHSNLSDTGKRKLKSSYGVFKMIEAQLHYNESCGPKRGFFWVTGMDSKNDFLFSEVIDEEDHLCDGELDPKSVFRMAVGKDADRVILIHHHLDRSLKPTDQDRELALYLLRSADLLKLHVVDYILIDHDDYFSFDEEGLMKELCEQAGLCYTPSQSYPENS